MKLKKLLQRATVLLLLSVLILSTLIDTVRAAEPTSAVGRVTTSWSALNVRSNAGTGGAIVSRLGPGTNVTLMGKSGAWWRVEYAPDRYGWISASYIKYLYGTYPLKIATSWGRLNVRSGPGSAYHVTGSIPKGRLVMALTEKNGWYQVVYNGANTGWISGGYVSSVMAWPVPASKRINQYFGGHGGIDIGAATRGVAGDAVIASQMGQVVYAGWLSGYGYVVYVNSIYNGRPIQTRYGHLSAPPVVNAGDFVGIGQKLGVMGNTGTSTGVHLHFEVRVRTWDGECLSNSDSTPVDPFAYL